MPTDAPDAELTSAFLFGPHSPPKHRPHTSVLFIKSSLSDLRFWCSSLGIKCLSHFTDDKTED